jgi:hypothetical protein
MMRSCSSSTSLSCPALLNNQWFDIIKTTRVIAQGAVDSTTSILHHPHRTETTNVAPGADCGEKTVGPPGGPGHKCGLRLGVGRETLALS